MFEDGLLVLTVNVALVLPAATVTLAGTVATLVLLLESVTTAPPEGAWPERVTVPWDVLPPLTLFGLSVREESVTALPGVMVSVACWELDPSVAVITAGVVVVTVCVLTVNDALVEPAGTVTLEGTVATELLVLLTLTAVADVGATLSVTVPCDDEPPLTVVGLSVSELSVTPPEGALTVSDALSVLP